MSIEALPDPPAPPEVERRIRLYGYQWIGLALLAVVPSLAIAGFFGARPTTETVENAGLALSVTYPDRLRYLQFDDIQVRVVNTSDAPLDTLHVALDSALANRFLEVSATPPFERPYELTLTDLAPGETRFAVIALRANEYGRHEGELTLRGGGSSASPTPHASVAALVVPLAIRVFP
jgi:hypothetical protein